MVVGITGPIYSQISGTPNFVGGGDVTVTESGGTVTISLTDDTGTDTQTLSISGDQLSISVVILLLYHQVVEYLIIHY